MALVAPEQGLTNGVIAKCASWWVYAATTAVCDPSTAALRSPDRLGSAERAKPVSNQSMWSLQRLPGEAVAVVAAMQHEGGLCR